MNTDTTMRLVTLPRSRQIHPIGHLPTSSSPQCPQCLTGSDSSQSVVLDSAGSDDTFLLGVRVRNARHFRRRRAVAAVVTTAACLALWSLLSVFAHHLVPAAAGDPIPSSAAAVHVVEPGDTLWSIASDQVGASDGQLRQVVDQLADRAGGPVLRVGQHLDLGGLGTG